jgi:hypothetical protein
MLIEAGPKIGGVMAFRIMAQGLWGLAGFAVDL